MAYIQESDITGLYTGSDTLSIPTSTFDFITSQIDATFTTQFDLFDQTYYVQMGESTTTIALKTPLYAIDLANSYYTTNSLINATTLDNIVPNDISQKLSPIIYVKESTTKYPPITDNAPTSEEIISILPSSLFAFFALFALFASLLFSLESFLFSTPKAL